MSARRGRQLSDEDRIVWAKVAGTARPLKGKAPMPPSASAPPEDAAQSPAAEAEAESVTASAAGPATPRARPPIHHFDQQTRDKLGKGRLGIDARVDLHGLTQGEAHGLLLSFLQRAHADGLRYVLVITGKGASLGSEGALKRAVPAWLSTPMFRPLVSGHDHAARQHGGAGAIYVRLRRRG
jgi:DNA-nicking Smr family endonuclease